MKKNIPVFKQNFSLRNVNTLLYIFLIAIVILLYIYL
jgi:hypothetical protein